MQHLTRNISSLGCQVSCGCWRDVAIELEALLQSMYRLLADTARCGRILLAFYNSGNGLLKFCRVGLPGKPIKRRVTPSAQSTVYDKSLGSIVINIKRLNSLNRIVHGSAILSASDVPQFREMTGRVSRQAAAWGLLGPCSQRRLISHMKAVWVIKTLLCFIWLNILA